MSDTTHRIASNQGDRDRDKRAAFRLSDEERAHLVARAAAGNVSLSDVVRALIIADMETAGRARSKVKKAKPNNGRASNGGVRVKLRSQA